MLTAEILLHCESTYEEIQWLPHASVVNPSPVKRALVVAHQ